MGPSPWSMSSASMKLPSSPEKVALLVNPLLTAPCWSLKTGVAKAAGASVDACAPPMMASAEASAIKHSKTGIFRLVIYEFLLDFRKCRDPRTQPYCRRFMPMSAKCGRERKICFGQSQYIRNGLRSPFPVRLEMGDNLQELTHRVK